MAVTYYDRAGWEFVLSQACSPVGDGQCDGTDYTDGNAVCECVCHDFGKASIVTVKQVTRMHHLGWLYEGHTALSGTRAIWTNVED